MPYSLRFHRVTFSVLEDMLNVAIGISTRNNKVASTVEMLVFRGSIVSHFHFPGVLSVNGNIARIFIFRERISKEDVFFVCRLIWVLFIEGLKHSNAKYRTNHRSSRWWCIRSWWVIGDLYDKGFIPTISFRMKLSVLEYTDLEIVRASLFPVFFKTFELVHF